MIMKNIVLVPFLILSAGLFMQLSAQTENNPAGPFETALSFICTSTSDDSIQLKATITVKREEGATHLANAPVIFSIAGSETEIPLGSAKTSFSGEASFKIPVRDNYPKSEDQLIHFKAAFGGTEKYESADGEFALKPARLVVSFYEEDSVRYIKVEGTQFSDDGSESPLGPVDLVISVPKMFSNLKIAEISLDSTGIGTAEFPNDIIGDSLGNLIVIASLDEHEVYGNIRGQSMSSWGLQKHLISPDRPSRELWTPIAPLWMIITLIIMLAGVWGHYIYAIIQLVKIRHTANKKVEEADESTI